MIYKTFYGSHIDLTKLVQISKAQIIEDSFNVGFLMHFQLMDNPLIYEVDVWEYAKEKLPNIIPDKGASYVYQEFIGGHKEEIIAEFQKQVNEIIKAWKYFKASKNESPPPVESWLSN